MDMDLHEQQSQHKVVTKSRRSIPKPRKRARDLSSLIHNIKGKISKRDQKVHPLIFQKGGLPDKTQVSYKFRGEELLAGHKDGRGINCNCCEEVVSPSQFEVHAGLPNRKKPYENIFLSNGVSLHDYALSLKLKCVGPNANAVARRRVSGVKPTKQIGKRSIRVVNKPDECYLVACGVCRSRYFSEDGFNDQTVIVCDQCEREYHIACLREKMKVNLTALPTGNWFCTENCEDLHSALRKLVTCGPEKVPDSLMDSITKKLNDSDADSITNLDVKWIIICGKDASEENKLLLTEAVNIFHDCFDPIIDFVTGSDFIPSMACGLPMGASNFSGVYSALLTIDSKVVTAGMFRVFGKEVAELPIVVTSKPNQGQGYFQMFFTCFEKLLAYLKIEKLVLPAADKAKAMWTKKFGFKKVTPKHLKDYWESQTSMVAFIGTTLLEKKVPKGQTTFKKNAIFSLSME